MISPSVHGRAAPRAYVSYPAAAVLTIAQAVVSRHHRFW